jgi:hypothetical protein
VTNDEAKAELLEVRDYAQSAWGRRSTEALDLALWWAEQQKFVDAIVAAETSAAEGEAVLILMDWQGEHPRPGS